MTTNPYYLGYGKHATADEGRCAMEFVGYLAGEPHTDTPACVSPVLTRFCVSFNDALPDADRQRLRLYLARTIGTRDDGRDGARAWLATDWLIRTNVPAWLALAGFDEVVGRLRELAPVLTAESLRHAMVSINEAGRQVTAVPDATWTAVWDAVWTAAWDATWAAAGAAAAAAAAGRSPAVDVARAAARAAAWAAARGAPWTTARNATRDVLQPTVRELQLSAFDLLDCMLPTEVIQLPVSPDAELVCATL